VTAKKGTLARLLVDEFDFSADTAGFGVAVTMAEQDSTTLQATALTFEPILPSMQIDHDGYVSSAGSAGDMEQELKAVLGVAGSYVAALLGTDVVGCPAYVLDGTYGAQLNFSSPAAGLLTINGNWGKGRGAHRGYRIFSGAISATGNQAAIDLGSAGSDGGEAYLFVQSITGSASSAQIKAQSSATEGGTYADEATLTFSAVGSFKALMTGTVNRWLRLNTASMGGATAFTVVLIVCVKGVTE